jgi:hypothetical protein
MPTQLDWRVGLSGEETVAATAPTSASKRGRAPLLSFFLALVYLVGLVIAAGVGFGLGRWKDAQVTYQQVIESRLAVESLAWRTGDASLFASTLDPLADPQWRTSQLSDFARLAPAPRDLRATRLNVLGTDRVEVDVESGATGGASAIVREYVVRDATWYQTNPGSTGAGPP